ncbi:hypothetical protein I4F81_004707 [Pyropia yezoensis]|uniref:Uncharacterized protein n=1 Tax=Pyropia yezoensis TaxID=2788 RepID=A0ACC3BXC7_PYRYE|nr:hypothetical protein I4F81_004707 [Neopyropia yezoensis]
MASSLLGRRPSTAAVRARGIVAVGVTTPRPSVEPRRRRARLRWTGRPLQARRRRAHRHRGIQRPRLPRRRRRRRRTVPTSRRRRMMKSFPSADATARSSGRTTRVGRCMTRALPSRHRTGAIGACCRTRRTSWWIRAWRTRFVLSRRRTSSTSAWTARSRVSRPSRGRIPSVSAGFFQPLRGRATPPGRHMGRPCPSSASGWLEQPSSRSSPLRRTLRRAIGTRFVPMGMPSTGCCRRTRHRTS